VSDLLVTTHTPVLGSGRALRVYGIVRALAGLGPVDLVFPWFGAEEAAPEFEQMENVTLHGVEPSRGLRRAAAYGRARLRGVPDGFARGISPELVAKARELAARPDRGRVVADGPTVAAALLDIPGLIYNAHNLESAFRHDAGDTDLGSRRSLERFERRLLERVGESWMASPADMEGAARLAPNARLRYVPNVVDVAAIEPVTVRPGRLQAVFIADFSYGPNHEAMRFLVDEVYPRVWQELPEARLALVGRGLDSAPDDARVEVLGFVENLRDAYASADVAVVPLLEGGGSPLKFVEALAHGLPVVATPKAAAGLEAEPGVHYVQGDGADAFAAALTEVLKNGSEEVAARGRKLAEERYSIEALRDALRG
jgi:glycosyltransferase involved in cell wall biosynthesis